MFPISPINTIKGPKYDICHSTTLLNPYISLEVAVFIFMIPIRGGSRIFSRGGGADFQKNFLFLGRTY